jgi:phosphate:Na+ symporter
MSSEFSVTILTLSFIILRMVESQNSYLIILLSGIAFILYGLSLSSHSLEKLLSNRIAPLLNRLSQNNILAIVVGISLTTLLQSSGAVTSMLVGLGTARVINLSQVMGVIIGTAVGSTLTVQLLSFNLSALALPTFVGAFTFYFASKKPTPRNIGLVLMGFAFVFFGMGFISSAGHHYANIDHMKDFFATLRNNPLLSLAISTAFCAFVHSSAVTISIAMGLASAGAISIYDAAFWVYGANIGTTSTALIAAAGSNYIGRQVAWAHLFYKALSVVIAYPFTKLLLGLTAMTSSNAFREIANFHLIFNIFSAIIFFPFIQVGSRWIEKLFPKDSKDEFTLQFLTMNNYQSTALASSYARREILRTADIVVSMIKDSIELFKQDDPGLVESIKERDKQVDFLYREIKMFLLDHANKSQAVVHQEIMKMIMFISDVERAADAIDINVTSLALKKAALKLEFSSEGWNELCNIHKELLQMISISITAFDNKDLCPQVIQLKRDIAKTEIRLRESHVHRLNRGVKESITTSSIHIDLLSEYKRIAGLLANHCY